MNLDVSVDGRAWTISLDAAGHAGRYAATVKGVRRLVDASWIDADTLSLLDGAAAYEVRVHRRGNGSIGVEIAGKVYECAILPRRGRDGILAREAGQAPIGPVSTLITAPMPGRVVRVLVAAGDRVAARQGLVVVEAMKMENELRAPRDGTVKEVVVAPGAAVDARAVLLVIE